MLFNYLINKAGDHPTCNIRNIPEKDRWGKPPHLSANRGERYAGKPPHLSANRGERYAGKPPHLLWQSIYCSTILFENLQLTIIIVYIKLKNKNTPNNTAIKGVGVNIHKNLICKIFIFLKCYNFCMDTTTMPSSSPAQDFSNVGSGDKRRKIKQYIISILVIAIFLGGVYFLVSRFERNRPLSDKEKLQLLEQLKAEAGPGPTKEEKIDLLAGLKTEANGVELSDSDKQSLLSSLNEIE